jgi:hypothetical protein
VTGTLDGHQRRPRRDEKPGCLDLLERAERIAGAVREHGGHAELRQVRRTKLGRPPGRVQRIREQQEPVDEAGLARGEHARLTAAVRLPAEKHASTDARFERHDRGP